MRASKLSTILITSTLLMLIPTTRVHADPKPKSQATPDQLMPHADPKPIPDIGNYHVITDSNPSIGPGQNYLSVGFSSPEGYICSFRLGPHYPNNTSQFSTGCLARHFPGMPPPNYDPGPTRTEKTVFESIEMDNMTPLHGFSDIKRSDFALHPSFESDLSTLITSRDGYLMANPPLSPGDIFTYTPPYSTGLYGQHGITPKPVSCALGYNRTFWCATRVLFNANGSLLNGTEGVPAGFYITPTETKWYLGYTDPGQDFP